MLACSDAIGSPFAPVERQDKVLRCTGPPTDFTSDASGAALQPSTTSTAWQTLLRVQHSFPSMPTSGYACNRDEYYGPCGIIHQAYALSPQPATPSGPIIIANPDELPDLVITIGAKDPTILALPLNDWFEQQSGSCCLGFTAFALDPANHTIPLPSWLSFSHNVTNSTASPPDALIPDLIEQYTLRAKARLRQDVVGDYTIRILATDSRFSSFQPVSIDLSLAIIYTSPTVVDDYPIVAIADAQLLQFNLDSGVFLLNQPSGALTFTAAGLPTWAELSQTGMLSGLPRLGTDADFQLNISVSDGNGDRNSTQLLLQVRAPCPAGLYRHLRLRITGSTPAYWGESSEQLTC